MIKKQKKRKETVGQKNVVFLQYIKAAILNCSSGRGENIKKREGKKKNQSIYIIFLINVTYICNENILHCTENIPSNQKVCQ